MDTSRLTNDYPPKHRWSRPVVPTFTYILIYCRCTWMISCRCWLSGDHSCGDHTSSKTQNHHHQHSAELQHVWCIFPYILQALCTLWSTVHISSWTISLRHLYIPQTKLYIIHTTTRVHASLLLRLCPWPLQQKCYTVHVYTVYIYIYYMNTNLYTYTYVISRLPTQLHTLESWNPEKYPPRGNIIAT